MNPRDVLLDAAAFQGELLNMLLAGMGVLVVLAILLLARELLGPKPALTAPGRSTSG